MNGTKAVRWSRLRDMDGPVGGTIERILGLGVGVLLASSAQAQVTQRLSVSSNGAQANGACYATSISADGRYVVFISSATNLVPSGTNGLDQVFVRDRQTGTTELVSCGLGGRQANHAINDRPAISADGRYVTFWTPSTNLVQGDTNDTNDVFVRDRQNGTTERVSVSSAGAQGDGYSEYSTISADGRYVAFHSFATNLVPGDTGGHRDTFVRDRRSGTTERVSISSSGAEGNNDSHGAGISSDGRYVAFISFASNLLLGDLNGTWDLFVHDRSTGTTERVSVGPNFEEANGPCTWPFSISADGRYVAWDTLASTLVPGDTNGTWDVFVRDRQAGTTERVNVSSAGTQADGQDNALGSICAISADGRYVVFESDATNLVPGDTNGTFDVFVRDRVNATTDRLSTGLGGAQGNDNSGSHAIALDGRHVAYSSSATNLVPGDTNGFRDVFFLDRDGGPSFASLCDPGIGGTIACPCSNAPSGPGRGCDNSSGTGGALLSASGGTFLSSDSLILTTNDEGPTALSIVLQGTNSLPAGLVYGQGVRCVGGSLERLYTRDAVGGSITVPDFGAGDPPVSVRSATKGDMIQPGQSRGYLVFYRDPVVLGGCPASSTFNATQTGRVDWSP